MKKIILLTIIFWSLISFENYSSSSRLYTMGLHTARHKENIVAVESTKTSILNDFVVVLDPGHGGTNEGAHAYFGNEKTKIIESVYCYDIVTRTERILNNMGITVYKTVYNSYLDSIDSESDNIIKMNTDTYFSYDNTKAELSVEGLFKRVYYANRIVEEHPNSTILYVSFHFDNLPPSINGVRIIKPIGSKKLANFLKDEFQKNYLLTSHWLPLLDNGDKKHGIKNIIVLRDDNKIKERVLIEFGNFKYINDVEKLIDYCMREQFAEVVAQSIVNYYNNENEVILAKN